MSGHSKWSTIKRQKGITDAKRSAVFTKLGKAISVAARLGGPDTETNFRLRLAIEKAREANMPNENVDRAIKKGAGAGEGQQIEEVTYEGFGPHGTTLLIQTVTDNRNRTVGEIRSILSKLNGSLGSANSVAWQFENLGVIRIPSDQLAKIDKETFSLDLIEAGAQDVQDSAEGLTILVPANGFAAMQKFIAAKNITPLSADLEFVAKQPIKLSEKDSEKLKTLIEAIDEHEDVTAIWTNAD
ncbi:MAG: YebC/PmpR family DNA-binding transcriptional regulator [Patescibacteria group bacterium]|jgi:YebC/PmpR family DNA-binding regulatory protein